MRIGFIGGGQMCEGIIKGLFRQNPNTEISVSEPYESRRQYLSSAFPSLTVSSDNSVVISHSDVVVIAVKPQQLVSAFVNVSYSCSPLFISICAGIPISKLESVISPAGRIARVMPNLPAMVAEGASGFCMNGNCMQSDSETVKAIFTSIGSVAEQVPESLMDVVTAVSGSGPAYVCVLIEAMADAAVREGMPRDIALKLAAQTCIGAGRMVLAGGDSNHPAVLKDKISSPGGTTIAAIAALEEHNFRAAVMSGVAAAASKSRDLAKL